MAEKFTYQFEQRSSVLETYEWDDIWWDHAEQTGKDRGLIIGDSISCGYRGPVNEIFAGEIYMDGLGTSKGIDNPFLLKAIDYVISQQDRCQVITFNNGLHGLHLSAKEYQKEYQKVICYLKENYPDKRLLIVLTTPVVDVSVTKLAERRNQIAEEIAQKENIPMIDFFSLIKDRWDLYQPDNVHLKPEGYSMLAKYFAEMVKPSF